MPIEFPCTHCGKVLRVPDEHLGKKARCPACQSINLIRTESPMGVNQARQSYQDPPVPPLNTFAAPQQDIQYSSKNPYEATAYQSFSHLAPHRGGLVLTLGIISLVCNFFLVPGILAWVFGSSDLKQMKAGLMNREGESLTMVGMILGIVMTVLPLLGILFYIAMIVIVILFGAAGAM